MSDERSSPPKGGVIPGSGAIDGGSSTNATLKKIPLTLTVRKEFELFSDFIDAFGRHVYPEGIFIPAEKPKPKGSAVRIDFRMRDGFQILLAVGEVVRADTDVPGAANGMWVSFRVLDKEQAALIRRIVDQRDAAATQASGGNTPSQPHAIASREEAPAAPSEESPGETVLLLEPEAVVDSEEPVALTESTVVSEGAPEVASDASAEPAPEVESGLEPEGAADADSPPRRREGE